LTGLRRAALGGDDALGAGFAADFRGFFPGRFAFHDHFLLVIR
jgi:hypothetical protein